MRGKQKTCRQEVQPKPTQQKSNLILIYNKKKKKKTTTKVEADRADVLYPEFQAAATQQETPPPSPLPFTQNEATMQASHYKIIKHSSDQNLHKRETKQTNRPAAAAVFLPSAYVAERWGVFPECPTLTTIAIIAKISSGEEGGGGGGIKGFPFQCCSLEGWRKEGEMFSTIIHWTSRTDSGWRKTGGNRHPRVH